jgi:hypothetical protein
MILFADIFPVFFKRGNFYLIQAYVLYIWDWFFGLVEYCVLLTVSPSKPTPPPPPSPPAKCGDSDSVTVISSYDLSGVNKSIINPNLIYSHIHYT